MPISIRPWETPFPWTWTWPGMLWSVQSAFVVSSLATLAINCPSRHDVRMMTTKELDEVIQQRLVRLDTPQPVRLPDSEAKPEVSEGFQPDSK